MEWSKKERKLVISSLISMCYMAKNFGDERYFQIWFDRGLHQMGRGKSLLMIWWGAYTERLSKEGDTPVHDIVGSHKQGCVRVKSANEYCQVCIDVLWPI